MIDALLFLGGWLLAGLCIALIVGPLLRRRSLPPRWSDAEFVRRSVMDDYQNSKQ